MFSSVWNDSESSIQPISAMDYMPADQLQALQTHRLQLLVARSYERVPLFRKRMDERKVRPEHIKAMKDISLLPTFCKTDLRDTYPFGLFASPMGDIVRLHASSGTTGKPIVMGYTEGDLAMWTSCVMRSLACAGLHSGDIIQNAYGYGLFTGGLGLHQGAQAAGLTVVPVSGGNTERQIMLMRDFGTTAVSCTPSYFLHLLDTADKLGINLRELPLRVGVFGAEPWSEAMRQRMEDAAGIEAYDIYGLTEICGPGVGIDCKRHDGIHIFEDHFYPEILHPDTHEPLPDGEEGELVFTTLTKQGIPMIRYCTHDLSTIYTEPCACGRTIRRIKKIRARTDDMLIIRGVNVFPGQIEAALLTIDQVLPHYEIVVTSDDNLDKLEVRVEIGKDQFSDEVSALETLRRKIAEAVFNVINIHVKVSLVGPNTIPRSEGKAKRVRDLRTK